MTVLNAVRGLTELIGHIKQLHQQLEATDNRRDQITLELGAALAEAKQLKPKGETWPVFVRLHFNFSRERADELIRIAGGTTTVEQVRQRTRDRVKKHRVLRNTGPGKVVDLFPKPKKRKPADTGSGDIYKQVTALYMELKNFSNDYCGRLSKWIESHELDGDCKIGLMEVLEDTAMSLQQLSQAVDGR